MKNSVAAIVSVLVLALSPAVAVTQKGAARTGLALAPGDPAPDLSIQKVDNSGKYVPNWSANELTVVNFWATFCEPCLREMPLLQEARKRHQDRKLEILGVLMDGAASNEKAQAFARELGVEYMLLRGTVRASDLWGGISILPTTFIIDARGTIVRRHVGGTAEQQKKLVADIDELLAKR